MEPDGSQPGAGRASRSAIGMAMGRIPSGLFVLTAQHEERRLGMLTSWVQQVCFEPPMITVAVAKGRRIIPLISDSRQFGLCQLAADDRVMMRKFGTVMDAAEDPFLGFELIQGHRVKVPLLSQAMAYLECELAYHMDVEGDHDLFVGRVVAGGRHGGRPHIHVRENGFRY